MTTYFEEFRHDPVTQYIITRKSRDFFRTTPQGLVPVDEFLAYDCPPGRGENPTDDEFRGVYLSKDSAEFVLGCRHNVRESQSRRLHMGDRS